MSWQRHMSKGTVAMVRADYKKAQTEFEHALNEANDQYDANDERTLRTIGLLGQTYFKLGDFGKAESFLLQSVETSMSQASSDSLTVAMDLLCLAAINKAAGHSADANSRAQQAVGVLQKTMEEPQENASLAVCELERLFAQAERDEREAVQAQFQALLLTASSKHPGESENFHPVAADLLNRWQKYMDLGLRYLRDPKDDSAAYAYRHFHEATKLAYRIFPHDHVNIALCLNLLGTTSTRLKMYEQAEAHLKRAATIYGSSPAHASEHACVKLNLAAFYAEIVEYRQALQNLTEAAEILESTTPLTDANSGQIYRSTLTIMTRAELYSNAREIIRQAIEAEESEHLEQAIHLYDRTLVLLRRVFPHDHLEIAQILHFKSNVLRKLGDKLAATGAQREAEAIENRTERVAQRWQRMTSDLPPFVIPPSRTMGD